MFQARLRVSALILAGAVTIGAVPAAQAATEEAKMSVYVGDLNLAKKAGAATALRRIHRAAERACGGSPQITKLREMQMFRKCREEMTERAVSKLRSKALAELHKQDTGESRPVQRTKG